MATHVASVPEMIRNHSFAANIISRHDTDDDILDDERLRELRRFCNDPSQKGALLREWDMVDEPGQRLGTRANKVYGSLTGYIIAHHGTQEQILRDEEIAELRGWFASGAPGI